ncbi:histone-like nucleoid-structuring protein Lsr2 [Catellatospora chokoriensis]|uniref:Lsr2 family protein n=1 Tax=Catellatospora chokoriensis TaxID=310353 RepID=A0A8J3KF49_9ACTN|nr:Lsr2 family protein [Catellatospora chokoriensis]GIF94744.1 Lsr2 family protein [Catellatospora chokoriensis]
MARRTIVVSTDDLDGSDASVESTRFSYEGVAYEIDLSAPNRALLAAALAPFIAAGRRSLDGNGKGRGARPTADGQAAFNRRVRDWSATRGEPVAERGRIPQKTVDAYLAAGLR